MIEGYDNESLAAKIDNEGFEYFFLDYISPTAILNEDLRKAILEFQAARDEISNILETNGVELY